MPVLPFYGSRFPELFAIERLAMDRPGRVSRALHLLFPRQGRLLDIGAGDGFMASELSAHGRKVVALEPNPGMLDRKSSLPWVRGDAEALPFRSACFDGAFATWAYFFPSNHSIDAAVREAERVVTPDGVIAVVNNLGGDEFCRLSPRDIAVPVGPFEKLGFSLEVIDTCFEFDSLEQARELLGFYFGARGRDGARLRLGYRVGLFYKRLAVQHGHEAGV